MKLDWVKLKMINSREGLEIKRGKLSASRLCLQYVAALDINQFSKLHCSSKLASTFPHGAVS